MGWCMVTDTHFTSGPVAENDGQQDALCLRDELMELANEILEDEPNAPTLPRSLQCTGMERDKYRVYARVCRKLCKLE
jgi:hypothetical protein